MSTDIVGMQIQRGPRVTEFVTLLESEQFGLVSRDGVETSGGWTLDMDQIAAHTGSIASQCPDLTLESWATLDMQIGADHLRGSGLLVLDSWTVEGWELELNSQTTELDDHMGTMRLRMGGDTFDEIEFAEGFFGGNDGETSTDVQFSTR